MKYGVIGTAGHVDHGKTRLIEALTGVNADRLQEEKRRGITIELGFAQLAFPDGIQAGIVDVPGHEKFLHHMLAGAGGMDLALLVVAADEGVMPQTREHLDILSLMGIQNGLIVLTKCDLCDAEWQGLAAEEIRTAVRGSCLEDAKILPVSAKTGGGIPELKAEIHDLMEALPEKDRRSPFRMNLDRVFSVDGFGTVATGTLLEGCLHVGDSAQLLPSGRLARIRSLQVHGSPVEQAVAGQRTAVNLTGVKKEQISRGDTLCKPNSVARSQMADVRLQNLPGSGRTVVHGSQVHLYHGAWSGLAKVVLLGRETLAPGESCYAQLRLAEPLCCKAGDRFVIRFLSPLETIGGGVILDPLARRHRQHDPHAVEALQILESGTAEARLLQALERQGTALPDSETLEAEPALLRSLLSRGRILEPLPGRYLAASVLQNLWDPEILARYHRVHPLHAGMQQAELRQKLLPGLPTAEANGLLRLLEQEGSLRQTGDRYALPEFSICLTRKQRHRRKLLLQRYEQAGAAAPQVREVLSAFAPGEREDCMQLLESLVTEGRLVMLAPKVFCHEKTWQGFCGTARDWFAGHEVLTLGQFRDLLGTSRDYALLVLERFDRLGHTKRQETGRILGDVPFFTEESAIFLDK